MTWALVFWVCSRGCTIQYVELYQTKSACVSAAAANKTDKWGVVDPVCVPTTEGGKK